MPWSPRETYDYLVCFATLMLVILGLVQAAGAAIDLVFPEPIRLPPFLHTRPQVGPEGERTSRERQEVEAEAARLEAHHRQLQRRRAVRNLATHGTLLVVAAPLFAFHWRRVRRRERSAPA